jgi:hypothetical protein
MKRDLLLWRGVPPLMRADRRWNPPGLARGAFKGAGPRWVGFVTEVVSRGDLWLKRTPAKERATPGE